MISLVNLILIIYITFLLTNRFLLLNTTFHFQQVQIVIIFSQQKNCASTNNSSVFFQCIKYHVLTKIMISRNEYHKILPLCFILVEIVYPSILVKREKVGFIRSIIFYYFTQCATLQYICTSCCIATHFSCIFGAVIIQPELILS